ncbi:MAG: inorganic phosphate transporter [Bdellovibrionales bacterium]|mgnify:CR=1 FL=1|jgi:inorganic phosphate transporter, PiT family|nr:inorganic phosphate transporter [Bdellovibrionales bacterium]MBT3526610.1 inorganic phosphate transporter [Bdellovibrionales bacterium]MBT7669710.1 inorganic phosphate transporter [Bdellovibrionales bacterium]MBT7766732.1 inorganic phosphate transporter [Bdellovibrionales bacterium]
MDLFSTLFFLSSGLFLGWSLGANDAANVFGTAVGSKMLSFYRAALICSVFLIIGAVVGGAGAAHTLGKLGAISTLPGAFTVALASALTVFFMTKIGLPVSTSQAIVGSIIGWNLFSGTPTDLAVVTKITSTWLICPLLSMFFSVIIYQIMRYQVYNSHIHLIRQDSYTRVGLIVVGAFGSYGLGANNIANVMGVFIPSSPFDTTQLLSFLTFTSTQKLFLLGGISIAVGVYTYSRRVMETVGRGLFKLSPVTAFVVVLSSSLVLFIFSSQELSQFAVSLGLPAIPLVPVSSSQAVVGAVLGIGLIKGRGKNIDWTMLFKIVSGWVATPVFAGVMTIFALSIMQNLFLAKVF